MTATTKPLGNRIPELDGLRGLAILMVVLFHFFIQRIVVTPGSLGAYAVKYFSFAWVGVDVFFVLSGFLVGGILMDHRGAQNFFSVFYLRRAARIFPLYLLFLTLFGVALWLGRVWTRGGVGWLLDEPFPFWSYTLYLQNFTMATEGRFGPNFAGVTWSLAVEEQFYLLFPLLVRWCPARPLPWVLGGLILAAPLMRAALILGLAQGGFVGFVLLPTRWDSLLLGALVAWLVRQGAVCKWIAGHGRSLRFGFYASLLVVVCFPVIFSKPYSLGLALFGYLGVALLVAMLLLLLSGKLLPDAARVLRLPVLVFFGKISYSLYLFHQAILGTLFIIVLGTDPHLASATGWGVTCGALVVAILFAMLTWVAFEQRLIQLGHRAEYRDSSAPT